MLRTLSLLALILGLFGSASAAPNGMVILFTDYGVDSLYVGILKGVILAKGPTVQVDSLTNAVPPFDIESGACMLAEGCPYFPEGAVFCCVVDPGVGSARKGIVLETLKGQYFVAPDNGLLTLVAQRDGIKAIHEITNTALWREGAVSNTFHGRDIFGPVAAALASGAGLKDVGPARDVLLQLSLKPAALEAGAVCGEVTRVDEYGNLITNIPGALFTGDFGARLGEPLAVTVAGKTVSAKFVKTYSDVAQGEYLALVQSSGLIECAINIGSLGAAIGAKAHDPVSIRRSLASQETP